MRAFFVAFATTIIGAMSSSGAQAADTGVLDTGFVPKLFINAEAQATATTSDGKLYVGGDFDWINGQPADWLARLNADGSLDTSFNPVRNWDSDRILALAPQSDGKLLLGYFFSLKVYAMANNGTGSGVPAPAKVSTAGTTTLTGSTNVSGGSGGQIGNTVGVDTTPILFTPFGGRIIRLNADGSVDSTFQMADLSADWASDNFMDVITFIQPGADGKILVGGSFQAVNGQRINNLVRLNADGSVDPTFTTTVNGTVDSAIRTQDGGTVIGGNFTKINKDKLAFGLAKLKANGKRDSGFIPHGRVNAQRVAKIAAGPGKNLLIATVSNNVKGGVHTGQPTTSVSVLDQRGIVDRTVATTKGLPVGLGLGSANAALLVTAPDQQAAATVAPKSTTSAAATATYVQLSNGLQGKASTATQALPMGFRPNGIFRSRNGWQARGSADNKAGACIGGTAPVPQPKQLIGAPAFWVGRSASAQHVQSSDKGSIIVSGYFDFGMTADGVLVPRDGLAKLDGKGFVEDKFAPAIEGSVWQMVANSDGGATFLASITTVDTSGTVTGSENTLVQLKADGSIDSSFQSSTASSQPVLSSPLALIRDNQGRLLVSGYSIKLSTDASTSSPVLKRFNKDGTPDDSFAPDFALSGNSDPANWSNSLSVEHVSLDNDGALLVAGKFDHVNGHAHSNVVRLLDDGSTDEASLTVGAPGGFQNILPRAGGGYLITASNLYHSPFFFPPIHIDPPIIDPSPGTIDPTVSPPTAGVTSNSNGIATSNLVVIGPIFPNGDSSGRSAFLGTTNDGAVDPGFSVSSLVPSSSFSWWSPYYGVKFVAPLHDGSGWVAMTKGLQDKASGKDVSLVIINTDGSIRAGYNAPEFGGAPNNFWGAMPIWWAGIKTAADYLSDLIVLDDNSVVVAGNFWSVNGEARNGVARLQPIPEPLIVILPTKAPSGSIFGPLTINSTSTWITASSSGSTLQLNNTPVIISTNVSATINTGIGTLTLTPGNVTRGTIIGPP